MSLEKTIPGENRGRILVCMNPRGFSSNATLFGIATVLILLGGAGYFFASQTEEPPVTADNRPVATYSPPVVPNTQLPENAAPVSGNVTVEKNIEKPVVNEPDKKISCPETLVFDFPIDIRKATSILYPGQIRGGDFKAHGGFRFDNSRPDEITVTAPIDASVVVGARYPAFGEVQYTLEFEHPCGIRYRLGHLLTLAPKFQAIAEKFPLPETLDSRTTEVRPPVAVKKGEIIATAVGLTGKGVGGTGAANTFVDWGVYDYRQKNEASKDPAWAAAHTSPTYQYGVCWFDWISKENRAIVLSLPSSDGTSGTQSDFCK